MNHIDTSLQLTGNDATGDLGTDVFDMGAFTKIGELLQGACLEKSMHEFLIDSHNHTQPA